jgi:hypothetical protein
LPRVDAKVSCSFNDNVDLNQLSQAISSAITQITGSQCRVVMNRKNNGISKIDIYNVRRDMQHNNIELMNRLNR